MRMVILIDDGDALIEKEVLQISETTDPGELFDRLLAADLDWRLEFEGEPDEVRVLWNRFDIGAEITRALQVRHLPVFVDGEPLSDLESIFERIGGRITEGLDLRPEGLVLHLAEWPS